MVAAVKDRLGGNQSESCGDAVASPSRIIALTQALAQSAAFRVMMIYMGLFGASVLVLLAFIYGTTAQSIVSQSDDTVTAEIDALYQHYNTDGIPSLAQAITKRMTLSHFDGGLYLLTTPDFQFLAGNLTVWPVDAQMQSGWMMFGLNRSGIDGGKDAVYGRGRAFVLPGDYRLLVGRDMRTLERFQSRMADAMLWAIGLTAFLGIGGGFLISRRVLVRLDSISTSADRIRGGDLSHRVALTGSGDELDRLAETLNAMLDQIERLMAGIRTVTNNIAHDLRSPLTRMRSQLEHALTLEAGAPQLHEICELVLTEADGLLATFNALLSIAEAEAGAVLANSSPVDVAGLIEDVTDLYGPLAEDKGLELKVQGAVPNGEVLHGNRELLFQALSNLIDNAIKYSPVSEGEEDRQILVGYRRNDANGSLWVQDCGPGIPREDRQKVIERFYRLDASRTTPGNGLGLSLVDAIARLHRAELVLSERPDGLHGLLACLQFPLSLPTEECE